MGVAGSGKSTVGAALAHALGARFVDGDALHPPANVAKMAAGIALDDEDRRPWLQAVRQVMETGPVPVVVACSALRRRYRDQLRAAGGVCFVYLEVAPDRAESRVSARVGHFMRATMVAGQYATLEPPAPDEHDVVTVDGAGAVSEAVAQVVAALHPGDP
jgi:gluconokinase